MNSMFGVLNDIALSLKKWAKNKGQDIFLTLYLITGTPDRIRTCGFWLRRPGLLDFVKWLGPIYDNTYIGLDPTLFSE